MKLKKIAAVILMCAITAAEGRFVFALERENAGYSDIGTKENFPADGQEPEFIQAHEEIDTDFKIKPEISLSGAENSFLDYGGDYAYNDFTKRSNTKKRQALYNDILKICQDFSADFQDVSETEYGYIVSEINALKYNLSENEVCEVFFMFKQDHPEYYWLSNRVVYAMTSDSDTAVITEVYILCYSDFCSGETRRKLNSVIEKTFEEYISAAKDNEGDFKKALIIHDKIIDSADYGYDENGKALDTGFAHSIASVFDEDDSTQPVCEGYSKAYQLLLNYFGIDNILVTGSSHAWNAVKLDGKWYQIDATWDDQPSFTAGRIYKYFLSESQYWETHYANSCSDSGTAFQYELPEFSEEKYSYISDKPDYMCGDLLTWSEDNGVITISGEGDMWYFTDTGGYFDYPRPWEELKNSAAGVIFEDGAANAGRYSFFGFQKIEFVQLGDSVIKIEPYAFYNCTGLKDISFSDNLSEISDSAFCKCYGLSLVNIPAGVKSIGKAAFKSCGELTAAISDGVSYIEDGAFDETDVLIKCIEGSFAQRYAKERGLSYGEPKCGDMDNDDVITAADAAAALEYILDAGQKPPVSIFSNYTEYIDADGNKKMNAADASFILYKALKSADGENYEVLSCKIK